MRSILRIIIYTLLWGLSGAVVGFGIYSLFAAEWIFQCMLLNVIAGLIMLQLILRNPELSELFGEGPFEGRPGSILIGVLWSMPFVMFFVGIFWWILAQVLK